MRPNFVKPICFLSTIVAFQPRGWTGAGEKLNNIANAFTDWYVVTECVEILAITTHHNKSTMEAAVNVIHRAQLYGNHGDKLKNSRTLLKNLQIHGSHSRPYCAHKTSDWNRLSFLKLCYILGMCGMDFSSSVQFWEKPRVRFGFLCRSVVKYKN